MNTKKELIEFYDEVIALLQQGEKYRKIVEGLEKDISAGTDIYSNWLRSDIKKLKQKYFPKEEASEDKDNNK